MTLGERIALARKKAGLSQEQLGDRLGVSRQAVSKWESSQANPDVAYVAELCRVCGVSCDWLLLGEEGAREAPPARCGSCGTIVTGLDRYCPQCGHPLQKEEADTYSLVLVDPRKNLTAAFDALAWLSRRPWCAPEFPICRRSQEELEALLFRAPVSLMWGLSAQRASEALAAFRAPGMAAVYRDSDGSSAEELERLYEGVAQICLEQGALDVLISDTEERDESIWKARGAFLEAIKGSTTCMDEVDIVVPRSRVDALVEYTHGLQAELGVRIKSFGHAGDGNLHAYILRDGLPDGVWEEKLALAMEKLYERGRQLCGQVSGEHGIGYAKRAYLSESLPPRILALMRAVKRAFDPKGILNPHKVCEP